MTQTCKHKRLELSKIPLKHIVFDHDGTLVDTSSYKRKLYEGIKELLEFTRSNKLEIYVWTARERRSTVEILESLDIISMFSGLSCGSEVAMKPSPEGIKFMLQDVDPDSVMVIGDSVGDIIGGNEFGATTVGAIWAYNDNRAEQYMKDNGANFTCNTVEDLKKIIMKRI